MKTKEEAIKEAWGEHFDTVKNHLNEEGWCIDQGHKLFTKHRIYDSDSNYDFVSEGEWDYNEVKKYRPKSLRNIENNNGWITLKGDPNEIPEDVEIWVINQKGDIELFEIKNFLPIGYATHYQPIIKPEKPIYHE